MYLRLKDISIAQPSQTSYGVTDPITPHTCRLSDMTYATPIRVDVEYIQEIRGQNTKMEKKGVVIGIMHVMLRSCCCKLYGKTESQLAKLGECPLDPGGYFIIKGNEKVLLMQHSFRKEGLSLIWTTRGT
ncbi:DNA-directed RNA polymerase III subunit 2-like [Prunus yedoensis var. nudiflora]|uniref:DNA-directed RNA polymerase n=1 Tax=Prunus yedoensis var. nudiflora TaxID=2094558 RepID=A0A314ZNU4_PRUYE|nr:DNA-directed RNA polymerase III subunit 2-like [Prunus yedoensis var. nudiflora]